ncbi:MULTISPECIES: NADPH-dependent FMN reductase [Streptomyces]|uniref:NADPH-dependent FMN reductase n=1 Tax=Streptomyces TaxID=1883 RepID=UPI00124FCC38|nr:MULTISPECIES: NADPH-dependent FMN reductase [Streptomyces]NYV75367.1 NAD(P)H-dependent oxidoreductase [Streptomyces sp. UH6]
MPRLQFIVASTRPGRVGPAVAAWAAEEARRHGGFEVEVVDLAEINLPFFDEPEHPSSGAYVHQHTKDWSATVSRADAFVFVMPEYNFSFTAPLKNAIDFLYEEWQYKPVGFVSYANGSAGLRAVQGIKQVVTTLKMTPVTEAVPIHWIGQRIDAEGVFQPADGMDEAAKSMFDELLRVSNALAPLRATAQD